MFKGKSIIIFIVLSVVILASWLLIQNIEPKLTPEEKSQIVSVINSYYNKTMDKDYENALRLVDISVADYDKAISLLKGNKDYRIERSLEGDSWLIPCNGRDEVHYDQQRKSFYTQTGARIFDSNYKYEATENVYVKKVGKEFKITNIVTDDKFGFIRGAYVKNFR